MNNWTDEQQKAINAEGGALLVCAAAGSGKTSVLTERIIRKLTDENDPVAPSSLLVVTFTNAAAAEMRSRIYKRLNEKLSVSGSPFLRSLMARIDEMEVCTMDAFCMKLVRDNFSVLAIEPDFDVIEQGEETALKEQTVRKTVDAFFEEGSEGFLSLAGLFGSGRDERALYDGIIALSDFSMSEPDPDLWLDGAARHFSNADAKNSVWGGILTRYYISGAEYCVSLYKSALSELADDAELLSKLESLYVSELAALSSLPERLENGSWDETGKALADALGFISSNRFPTLRGYKEDPLKISVQSKRDEIKKTLKKLIESYPANSGENADDVSALGPAAAALIRAVKEFNRLLFEQKKEKNLYGFSDITHFAVKLLCDPGAPDGKTPLARDMSEELSEILIDEYQDTNRVQDALFTSLSRDGSNMFLVGDVKQSIYRFRLASPELFVEKLESYPDYDPEKKQKRSKLFLSKNFRSREGITQAVNFLFSSVMSKECGEITYSGSERLVFGADSYPASSSPDVSLAVLDAPEIEPSDAEAEYIAGLIEEKLASGLTVFEKGAYRPASYGDFCILLRSFKGSADSYVKALKKRSIPVSCDYREGFFETAEIRIAVSLLRAADNPLRSLDLLAAMLSPLGCFTPESASKIKCDAREQTGDNGLPLFSALMMAGEKGDPRAKSFLTLLERFRRLGATAQPDEIIDALFNETPLLAAVSAMDAGAQRAANLRSFYEASVKFSADPGNNLSSFVRYIETLSENSASLRGGSSRGDKNSVAILTVHASKGLEFPFVIVAGLTKKFNLSEKTPALGVSHSYGVGLKRREPENLKFYETLSSCAIKTAKRKESLSEEMRIYYVALTRAREKLFIVCAPGNLQKDLAEAQALLPNGNCAPPFYVITRSSPLPWFLSVFSKHADASALRTVRGVCPDAGFALETKLVKMDPQPVSGGEPCGRSLPDEAVVRRLITGMVTPYKYAPVENAPSLHAASSVQEEKFSEKYFGQSLPAFMFDSSLSPVDIGTATHKFLQFCDFSAGGEDVEGQIKALVSLSRLTSAEGENVDKISIKTFFSSPLFERIMRSECVFREKSFIIRKSVCDFDPSLPRRFADENAVVRGRIDLVFIEDGKAVVVDYKTDRVNDLSELIERYGEQMELYSEAVEKAFGYEVKERILYSLTKRDFIGV